MKIISAISILCVSIALAVPSCINENSNQHSKPPSSDDRGNPEKIQFELDPIQGLAADDPGNSFSKLIRNANKNFIDSLMSCIETKDTHIVLHSFENFDLNIGVWYKIKNAGNFLFADTNKAVNMIKLINYN